MSLTDIELDIGGMTCASCATRVERKLNRMPGVEASVNYATEKARVRSEPGIDTAALIAVVESAGYTAAVPAPPREQSNLTKADGETASLRRRLIVSATLTLPVVLLSMITVLQFPNWQWLVLTLAAPVSVWGAWPFHRAAWVNARHGAATMDTLISVGVLAAFGWSLYALFFGTAGMPGMRMSFALVTRPGAGVHDIYLEVATAVTVFILAGRYFEARAKRDSGEALRALLELGAKDTVVLRNGVELKIPVDQLMVGDRFVVRPGEKVATDGIIVDGASAVNASMLTGESAPIDVTVGDRIVGATLNVGGRLVAEVTRVGADTELSRLGRLVEEAQTGKADVQRLADRVSAIFVPVVIGLFLVTFAAWTLIGGSLDVAFTAAIATLIVACPCALGLATPTALLVGTGRGSQLGLLIRGPQVLEDTRRIDTIVLDKTGTVTTGQMVVTRVLSGEGVTDGDVVGIAAIAEHGSEHPLARAIAASAYARGFEVTGAESFQSTAGFGVQAIVGGSLVLVGRGSWLTEHWTLTIPSLIASAAADAEATGQTAVLIAWDGVVHGMISAGDEVKPDSVEAVRRLRELGLHPILLTGDNAGVAAAIAARVDIHDVRSDVTPAGKLEAIRELQAQGRVVAMVGDGVNDAAALAAADLGIAMGTGTDAAIAASDITVMSSNLLAVGDALRLARRTLAVIRGNLFWAFAYNVAAIPIAMLGLLNPLIAGAAMAFSSVFVVSNSLRLRRFRPLHPGG